MKFLLTQLVVLAIYTAVLNCVSFVLFTIYTVLGLNNWQSLSYVQSLLYVSLACMVIGYTVLAIKSQR